MNIVSTTRYFVRTQSKCVLDGGTTLVLSDKLKLRGSSFLVASSRRCPQQVVRVGLVEFGEQHDTRTNGQHYNTAADRRPTNQVNA